MVDQSMWRNSFEPLSRLLRKLPQRIGANQHADACQPQPELNNGRQPCIHLDPYGRKLQSVNHRAMEWRRPTDDLPLAQSVDRRDFGDQYCSARHRKNCGIQSRRRWRLVKRAHLHHHASSKPKANDQQLEPKFSNRRRPRFHLDGQRYKLQSQLDREMERRESVNRCHFRNPTQSRNLIFKHHRARHGKRESLQP